MEVTVLFFYGRNLLSFNKITVKSYLIDEAIDKWNSTERPFIYRSQCFICDSCGNIYKDTDTFFVESLIEVIQRPPIGQPFLPNGAPYLYPRTLVRNNRGEEFDTNQDFSDKGDCYIVRITRDGDLPRGDNPEMRAYNLRRIKDVNALGDKLNTLELLANKQGQSFYGQNSIIAEMISGGSAHRPVNESKTKRIKEEDDEGGPICVIV